MAILVTKRNAYIWCLVQGCKYGPGTVYQELEKGISLHKFPTDPDLLRQWKAFVNFPEDDFVGGNSRVCSLHFADKWKSLLTKPKSGGPNSYNCTRLKKGAVPTIYNVEEDTAATSAPVLARAAGEHGGGLFVPDPRSSRPPHVQMLESLKANYSPSKRRRVEVAPTPPLRPQLTPSSSSSSSLEHTPVLPAGFDERSPVGPAEKSPVRTHIESLVRTFENADSLNENVSAFCDVGESNLPRLGPIITKNNPLIDHAHTYHLPESKQKTNIAQTDASGKPLKIVNRISAKSLQQSGERKVDIGYHDNEWLYEDEWSLTRGSDSGDSDNDPGDSDNEGGGDGSDDSWAPSGENENECEAESESDSSSDTSETEDNKKPIPKKRSSHNKSKNPEEVNSKPKGSRSKTTVCEFCGQVFSVRSFAWKYHHSFHENNGYKCHECGKHCGKTIEVFRRHLLKNHDTVSKKYECTRPRCQYITTYKKYFRVHMQNHDKDQTALCDQCGASFKNGKLLYRHRIRTHSNARPHHCPECTQSFKRKDHLQVHLRIHSDEKPYKCDFCDYAGKQATSLKMHLKHNHRDQVL